MLWYLQHSAQAHWVSLFFFWACVAGSHCHGRPWFRLQGILAPLSPSCRAFGPGLLCPAFFLQLFDNNFQGVPVQLALSPIVTSFALRRVLVLRSCARRDGGGRNPKETGRNSLAVQFRGRQRLTVHAWAGVQVEARLSTMRSVCSHMQEFKKVVQNTHGIPADKHCKACHKTPRTW